jgi:hypothetical protein
VIDGSQVERVLVITAHPDDVDFGASNGRLLGLGEGRSGEAFLVVDTG